jgi:hypothetical protein
LIDAPGNILTEPFGEILGARGHAGPTRFTWIMVTAIHVGSRKIPRRNQRFFTGITEIQRKKLNATAQRFQFNKTCFGTGKKIV